MINPTLETIVTRVSDLENRINQMSTANVIIARISDVSDDLGILKAGKFLCMSAGGEPSDPTSIGTFISSAGESCGTTDTYHIGGVNLGVIQWGANSQTGKFIAGAGAVVLDADGLSIAEGLGDVNAIKFYDGAFKFGEIYGVYVLAAKVYRMTFGITSASSDTNVADFYFSAVNHLGNGALLQIGGNNPVSAIEASIFMGYNGFPTLPVYVYVDGVLTVNQNKLTTGRFNVQGSTDTNLIITDSTDDVVAMGGAPDLNYKLKVYNSLGVAGTNGAADAFGVDITTAVNGSSRSYGLDINSTTTDVNSGGTGGLRIVNTFSSTSGGPQGNIYGVNSSPNLSATNEVSVQWLEAYNGWVRNLSSTGGVLDNAAVFYAKTSGATGTITNSYGLYVEDVNTGGTLNYAIYTNAGLVRFGDAVVVTGTIATAGGIGLTISNTLTGATSQVGLFINTTHSAVSANGSLGLSCSPYLTCATTTDSPQVLYYAGYFDAWLAAACTINVTTAIGVYSRIVSITSAVTTITNAYVYYAANPYKSTSDNHVTNAYGLFIENITAGETTNYAIYTGSGDVRLGGKFGCNAATPQAAYASGGAAPAGGTGATAGAYDTAAHRDALITLVNNIRTALINNGIMS